jgi:hypothetical protein
MPLINNATVTRIRFTGTRGADGRYVNAIESATPDLPASVQGPEGNDLQTLPEGDRTKEVRKVYLDLDVRAADQHAVPAVPADQLVIDSVVYEVRKVWPWRPESLIPHHKCLAVRLKE